MELPPVKDTCRDLLRQHPWKVYRSSYNHYNHE